MPNTVSAHSKCFATETAWEIFLSPCPWGFLACFIRWQVLRDTSIWGQHLLHKQQRVNWKDSKNVINKVLREALEKILQSSGLNNTDSHRWCSKSCQQFFLFISHGWLACLRSFNLSPHGGKLYSGTSKNKNLFLTGFPVITLFYYNYFCLY